MKKIFFLAVLFFGAKLVFGKISLAKNIDFDLKGFVLDGNLITPSVKLEFIVNNKTNGVANLQGINAELFLYNGAKIGNAILINPVLIAANTTTSVFVDIQGLKFSLLQILLNLQTAKNLTVSFDGFVTIDGQKIYLKFDKKLI
jgi:hypothetical protein